MASPYSPRERAASSTLFTAFLRPVQDKTVADDRLAAHRGTNATLFPITASCRGK